MTDECLAILDEAMLAAREKGYAVDGWMIDYSEPDAEYAVWLYRVEREDGAVPLFANVRAEVLLVDACKQALGLACALP